MADQAALYGLVGAIAGAALGAGAAVFGPMLLERNAEAELALGQVEAARAELAAYIKGRLDARSADLSAPREAHRE